MDKLVEREESPRSPIAAAPALAVQFFLIPLAVVAITVGVYLGFRAMLSDERAAREYLNDVRFGGANRSWPAAYELSRVVVDRTAFEKDPGLAPAIVEAFAESKNADPRVRRYLAMALGRLPRPVPARAVTLLTEALDDADSETQIAALWALGAAGDPTVVGAVERRAQSPDPGIRKIAVYALGALPGSAQIATMRTALEDLEADVRWNAAVALARHGDRSGLSTIRQMLDREQVANIVKRTPRPWYWLALPTMIDESDDPVGDVMISGLQAAAALRESGLRERVEAIVRSDRNFRVRQAASDALKAIESSTPQSALRH